MTEKELYRAQMDSVCFDGDFAQRTAELLKRTTAGKDDVMTKNKLIKIIIAAAVIAVMLSGTVFAAVLLLTPEQVADRAGENGIAAAFAEEDAVSINESRTVGEYVVTLLGIASGDRIDNINGRDVESERSYIVVSISAADGTPLSTADGMPLSVTPLVEGFAPWHVNAWGLGSAVNGIAENGVLYYLFDCATLEIFADHTIYLAVFEGFAPTADIFTFGEDGSIDFRPQYDGAHALFTIPLDPSAADPEAVEAFMEQMGLVEQ